MKVLSKNVTSIKTKAVLLILIGQFWMITTSLLAQGVKVYFPKYLGNTANVMEAPDRTLVAATNKKDSATQEKWDIIVTNFNVFLITRRSFYCNKLF